MVSKIANGDGYKILDDFLTYHMILNYTVDTLEIIPADPNTRVLNLFMHSGFIHGPVGVYKYYIWMSKEAF